MDNDAMIPKNDPVHLGITDILCIDGPIQERVQDGALTKRGTPIELVHGIRDEP